MCRRQTFLLQAQPRRASGRSGEHHRQPVVDFPFDGREGVPGRRGSRSALRGAPQAGSRRGAQASPCGTVTRGRCDGCVCIGSTTWRDGWRRRATVPTSHSRIFSQNSQGFFSLSRQLCTVPFEDSLVLASLVLASPVRLSIQFRTQSTHFHRWHCAVGCWVAWYSRCASSSVPVKGLVLFRV